MQPRQRPFTLASLAVGVALLASCASLPSTGALGAASGGGRGAAAAPTAVTSTAAATTTDASAATTDSAPASGASAASATSTARRRAARTATSTSAAAPAASSTSAATGQETGAASAATLQAIKDTIQRANDEQAQAFAKNDPTVMRDTATTSYYNQLVQIQRDMENAGVTAIKLSALEWGPVNVQGSSAQATTYETWLTTLSDGSTQQDRERNVYTLVQQGSAWKVQTDAHPDANLDQSTGGNPSPTIPSPGVIPGEPGSPSTIPAPLPATAPSSGQSRNWSGYAATGSDFTAVSGTWKVPQVTTDGGYGADASWVGIGGVNTRDLIQAGTDATAAGSGVRYTAWVETLPQVSHTVPLTVSPGDSVTVSISQQSDGTWQIAFKDNTTGQSYQTTTTYNSSLSSAEWVEEAPAGGRRVLPLDNFGTVQFTNGSAVENGKTVSIAQAGAKPITMIDRSGQPIAQPSALGSGGSSFSVKRLADSSTAPVIPGAGQSGNGFPGGQGGGLPGAVQPGSGFPGAGNGVAPSGRGGRGRSGGGAGF